MKHAVLKRALGLFMALCLLFPAGLGALAAGGGADGISVQLNGEPVTFVDAVPQMRNDRVFLPIRRLCELIGAEVISFDQATNTVVIGKDGTEVTFVNGRTGMTIESPDGTVQSVATDVASYEDKTHYRTMVPVRFLSEALNLNVGWDNDTQTVLLLDTTVLTDQLAGKFSLMNEYQASSAALTAGKTFAVTGEVAMDMTFDPQAVGTDAAAGISATGTLSGLESETAAQLQMDMDLDLTDLLAQMTEEELADPATQAMIAQLEQIDMEYRMDLTAGTLYWNAGSLTPLILPDATADSWLSLDLASLYESMGIDYAGLMGLNSASVTLEEAMGEVFTSYPLTSVDDFAQLQQMVDEMLAMYGDDAFVRQGSRYVSTYNLEQDGVQMVMQTVLSASSDQIDRFQMTLSTMYDREEILSMDFSCQENLDTAMTLRMALADTLTMEMTMNLGYAQSSSAPATQPPAGAAVIPLDFGPVLEGAA